MAVIGQWHLVTCVWQIHVPWNIHAHNDIFITRMRGHVSHAWGRSGGTASKNCARRQTTWFYAQRRHIFIISSLYTHLDRERIIYLHQHRSIIQHVLKKALANKRKGRLCSPRESSVSSIYLTWRRWTREWKPGTTRMIARAFNTRTSSSMSRLPVAASIPSMMRN